MVVVVELERPGRGICLLHETIYMICARIGSSTLFNQNRRMAEHGLDTDQYAAFRLPFLVRGHVFQRADSGCIVARDKSVASASSGRRAISRLVDAYGRLDELV